MRDEGAASLLLFYSPVSPRPNPLALFLMPLPSWDLASAITQLSPVFHLSPPVIVLSISPLESPQEEVLKWDGGLKK